MGRLPEHIYLITVDNEWPVSAIAVEGSPAQVASYVDQEVARRLLSRNATSTGIHVWKAQLAGVTEMEFVPRQTTEPQLRELGGQA